MKQLILIVIFACFFSLAVYPQQQLQNPGFEEWEEVGTPIEEPLNWSSIKTSDNELLNPNAPKVCEPSNDAHSGNYSLHLFNVKVAVFNVIASGLITTGRVHAEVNPDLGYVFTDATDAKWHMPFTGKPDSITGWYMSTPAAGDFARIQLHLHEGNDSIPSNGDNVIGEVEYDFPEQAVTNWTRFSVPINYLKAGTPQYVLLSFTSGNGVDALEGSEAWFDDIEFIYNGSSVDELSLSKFRTFYRNNTLTVSMANSEINNYNIRVTDIMGRVVLAEDNITAKENQFQLDETAGVYVVSLQHQGSQVSRKITIQ